MVFLGKQQTFAGEGSCGQKTPQWEGRRQGSHSRVGVGSEFQATRFVCAVPVTAGCREVRGHPAHCAPYSPPWRRGGWGTAPQDGGGWSRRGPGAHCDPARADGQGEGRRRQQLVPPASGSPAEAGVRGGDGSEWQKPSRLSPPPPAPQPSSALQEASPQIPCLESAGEA